MTPTPRLLLILLVVAALGAFGGLAGALASLLVPLVLLMAVLDWGLARDVRRLVPRREVEQKLSLGEWNPVRVRVTSPLSRATRIEARDSPPSDFLPRIDSKAVRLPVWAADVAGGAEVELSYQVSPRHRGDFLFGDVWIRATGPLGLARRSHRFAGSGEAVRVYPNLRDLKKYDLLARRGMLIEAGSRAVRVAGASTEFERLREYLPDDEYRRINWKATARRGKPIVNQFEAERSQNLVLMIDAGRLMSARADLPATDEGDALSAGEVTTGLTKLDHALNSALLLAYVASLRGDRVALLAYTDTVRTFVPPTRGRRAFVTIVQALYNLESQAVEPDHGLAFQFLASRNLRRSLVVQFTDLADRESSTGLVGNLLLAARHHQVVCVTLADPTVAKPAVSRPRDSQGLYEKMVAQRMVDDRAGVLALLGQRGVIALDTDADKLSPKLVGTYLELKQRGRV